VPTVKIPDETGQEFRAICLDRDHNPQWYALFTVVATLVGASLFSWWGEVVDWFVERYL